MSKMVWGTLFGVGVAVVLLVALQANADYVLSTDLGGVIPVVNRDFEEPNDGKHTAFDVEKSRKKEAPFNGNVTVDVPGWFTDTSCADSGLETATGHGWVCYLMGSYSEWDDLVTYVEPPVWQILSYKVQAGDKFCLCVDAADGWTANWFTPPIVPTLKMSLFYVDIGGARKTLASTVAPLTATWTTCVLDVNDPNTLKPAVGRLLGVEFQNIAAKDSWIHVDNVSFVAVKEPTQ